MIWLTTPPRTLFATGIVLTLVSTTVAQPTHAPITADQLYINWKQIQQYEQKPRSYKVEHALLDVPNFVPLVYEFGVRPDRWVFSSSLKGESSAFATSPRYTFLLNKSPKGNDWAIRLFSADSSSTEAKQMIGATHQLGPVRPLSTVFTVTRRGEPSDPTILEMVAAPSYRLKSITTTDGRFDTVQFEYANTSFSLVTDRTHSSLIVRGTAEGGKGIPKSRPWRIELRAREVELVPGGTAFRCKRIEYTQGGLNDPKPEIVQYTFRDYVEDSPSDNLFTLSHYGLPEPVGVEPLPTPRYVWFLIAAVAFAIVAVAIRYFARRRAAPAQP